MVTDDGGYVVSASIDVIPTSFVPPIFDTIAIFLPPPVIQFTDNFQDSRRTVISASSGLATFSNVQASREPGEPLHDGKTGQSSMWMTWIAPAVPGIAHFDTRGSGFDTLLAVYQGDTVGKLTRIASDDDSGGFSTSSLDFAVQPQGTYFIAIDGRLKQQGLGTLAWNFNPGPGEVPLILTQPQSQSVALGGTTRLVVTYSPPNAVVRWTLNGQVISLGEPLPQPGGNQLIIANMDLSRIGRYRAIVSSARDVLSQPATVQVNAVDRNVAADVFTEDKFVDLVDPATFKRTSSPVGLQNDRDNFKPDNAPARGYSGTLYFSSIGSTAEPGEPVHCGVPGGASEWHAVQAEANGVMTIDTIGSSFDTILAAYTDPSDSGLLNLLIPVLNGCNNDIGNGVVQSSVTFPCEAGTIYYVAVDGAGGATGSGIVRFILNRLPTISDIPNTTVNEDTPTPAIAFTVGDVETAPAALQISVITSDPVLVPLNRIVIGGSGANRTVTITPGDNASGLAIITLKVTDANGGTSTDSFNFTVNPQNDPPTLNPISDVFLLINAAPGNVGLGGISAGPPGENQTLGITASSSNTALVSTLGVAYTSPGATANLAYSIASNATGAALISVTVSDGQASNSTVTRTFNLSVIPKNQPPEISTVPDQSFPEGKTTPPLPFTISDPETTPDNLLVSASSSDQSVVKDSSLVLSGTGANRFLTITPTLHKTGKVNITVQVKDPFGVLVGRTFALVLFPANDQPVASPQSISTTKNVSLPITISGIDPDGDPLTYSIVSSPIHGSLSGSPPNMVYTPNSGVTGADFFFFKANDGVLDSLAARVSITINEEPIRFVSFSAQAGQFAATFKGAIARDYVVEVSADLKNWTSTSIRLNTTGTLTHTDSVQPNQSRFYRARLAQ